MAEGILEFTDENFQSEVLDSSGPVLVDFWAPWCGPCKALAPILEELAGDYAGKVRIGKVNTDDNRQTAADNKIEALPTVVLFKGGERVDTFVGLTPKEKIAAVLDGHVN